MKIFKKLQNALIGWLLTSLVIIWLAVLAISFIAGNHEADELTDGRLVSLADLVLTLDVQDLPTNLPKFRHKQNISTELAAHDYQLSLSVILWDAQNDLILKIGASPMITSNLGSGFHNQTLPDQNLWRIFVAQNSKHKVAILLSMSERDSLANDIALQVITPLFLLLPIIALILALVIKRGLKPLHKLSFQIKNLDIKQPVNVSNWQITPYVELQRIIAAIADLSNRYLQAIKQEADAADSFAHELRTPLTSMQLNIELLADLKDKEKTQKIIQKITQDAQTASNYITNLLDLARAKRINLSQNISELDLCALSQDLLSQYAPLFIKAQHQISLHAPKRLLILGHQNLLAIALRNLLDNALTHNTNCSYNNLCN